MKINTKTVLISIGSAAVTALSLSLLVNIQTHKEESKHPYFQVVQLTDDTEDPAIWGKNFPQQYHDYLMTVDQERTRYGGSEAIPHSPTLADPRDSIAQSKIEEDQRLVTMWAGYAFSKDFREERGHAYMLDDQKYTQRQVVVQQPGTCINCHASTYVAMKKLGKGDLFKGFDALNHMTYQNAQTHVSHAVACIDCHDPSDMHLRVTRPAFIEGIAAYKREKEGIRNYDVNKHASPSEMRSFVCGQCHVEYYFKGEGKRLTYPWNKGLKADEILDYYQENGHKDWIHALTQAPTLKAQHPEFEMYSQGIHARSGVSCVDCHMPFKKVGAMKITDHHVRSPLLNVQKACQTCHRLNEEEILERVSIIQDRHMETRNIAFNALVDLIDEIKAKKASLSPKQLKEAQEYHRKAQFLFDFVEAENSTGLHAPQESQRVLAKSIDFTRRGQNALK